MSDFIVIWCPIHCPISWPISYPILCFLNKFRKIYLTFLWNDLTIDWNDLTWNNLTMERNDRKSRFLVRSFVRTILFAHKTVISARFLREREASPFFAITPCYMQLPKLIFTPIFVKPGLIVSEVGTSLTPIPESPISANPGLKILYLPPPPSRGGVLRVSSDRDDWKIFWGFEIFYFGIFLRGKILASICFGSLI